MKQAVIDIRNRTAKAIASIGMQCMRKTKALNSVLRLYALSLLVGIVAGVGAVIFRGMIALLHNVLFLGRFSLVYDANAHTPASPWGAFVVLVPVVGAAAVAFLVSRFAPEAKGHGVPEVMDAIYYNNGVIRPIVAVIKSLASAISIGSGGSVGREGPIIQIGASFGSTLGQVIRMPPWQRITLIAAGAGGGIAATFNTPIGGVLFAVEIMLQELSARTLVPLAIATATATYIGRLCFGPYPSFVIPELETPYFHVASPWLLLSFAVLGILLGFISIVYIKSIYAFEDFFEQRVTGNYYMRHMSAMFLVGVVMYVLMICRGHYYTEGVGYATIQDVLTGQLSAFRVLLLLFLLKLLVTSLTLGSGALGGIFSPALFMGATVGAAYGLALRWCFPGMEKGVSGFAVAGMAGVVGGATGAATAAIVMIFEMTLDYRVIIPITITVALSYGIRRALCRESIYTMKLSRRGHHIPAALRASLSDAAQVRDVMRTGITALPACTALDAFARTVLEHPEQTHFLVHDGDRVLGVVRRDAALGALGEPCSGKTLGQVANGRFVVVSPDSALADMLGRMHADGATIALVAADADAMSLANIRGVVTEYETADAMVRAVHLFSD